jgi:hypothetical protein
VMTWRRSGLPALKRVGLMTHFLQLAKTARGWQHNICMVKSNSIYELSELAKGFDHNDFFLRTVTGVEKSLRSSHCWKSYSQE